MTDLSIPAALVGAMAASMTGGISYAVLGRKLAEVAMGVAAIASAGQEARPLTNDRKEHR